MLPEAPVNGISLKKIFDDLYKTSQILKSNSEIENAIKIMTSFVYLIKILINQKSLK